MQQTLDYLYGLTRFGIKPGLETIRELLNNLENPQNGFKSVHVAGTNGKGSTSALLASILKEAGYKVGLYTSPHLIKFNERIKINGEEISDQELVKLTKEIKNKLNNLQPTFFEFTTALTFLYFAQKNVDIAIIETGLGGRLDATNVLTPEISIITNIGLDHTEYLGNTKEEIAEEKAGIIKPNIPLITVEEDENVLKIFRKKTDQIYLVNNPRVIEKNLDFQKFKVYNQEFTIPLLGEHQVKNASTSILAAEILKEKGFKIKEENIKDGLSLTQWPGRLQIISKEPLLILDGAHNVAGMKKLKSFIENINKRKILVIGISEGKDVSEMVSLITPLFDEVIITQGNFKPQETSIIAKEVKKYCRNVKEISGLKEALNEALSSVKKDEMVLVTGSLYLVGDMLKKLNSQNKPAKKG